MSAFNTYRSILESALSDGETYKRGLTWYDRQRAKLETLSEGLFPVERMAGAVAILSPLTPWERNLQAAHAFRRAMMDEYPKEWLEIVASRHTVFNNNARKAVRFLLGETDEINGPKVESFYLNLSGDLEPVTIDSHMFKAVHCFGLQSEAPTGNAIRSMRSAVRMLATLYELEPAQVQAIVWCQFRSNL